MAAQLPLPVWLLLGPKAGDNQQVRTLGRLLAAALAPTVSLPIIEKSVDYRATELVTNLCGGPNLYGVLPPYRGQFVGPWPQLVISAGRRNEPVARWIQQQAKAQENQRVNLVHLGRPWADLAHFDAILATRQYHLPDHAHIHWLDLPLHDITPARLHAAAHEWASAFAPLPRPWMGVLLGGNSGPLTFYPAHAAQFGRQLNRLAKHQGGAVLVTASRRTPVAALHALVRELTVPYLAYPFGHVPNPYLGLLALADYLVVTADSASMVAEACATNRPVYLWDLRAPHLPWRQRWGVCRWPVISHHLARRLAPRRFLRDLPALLATLVAAGRVRWLSPEDAPLADDFPTPSADPGERDRQRAVQAVLPLIRLP